MPCSFIEVNKMSEGPHQDQIGKLKRCNITELEFSISSKYKTSPV